MKARKFMMLFAAIVAAGVISGTSLSASTGDPSLCRPEIGAVVTYEQVNYARAYGGTNYDCYGHSYYFLVKLVTAGGLELARVDGWTSYQYPGGYWTTPRVYCMKPGNTEGYWLRATVYINIYGQGKSQTWANNWRCQRIGGVGG